MKDFGRKVRTKLARFILRPDIREQRRKGRDFGIIMIAWADGEQQRSNAGRLMKTAYEAATSERLKIEGTAEITTEILRFVRYNEKWEVFTPPSSTPPQQEQSDPAQ